MTDLWRWLRQPRYSQLELTAALTASFLVADWLR